jgi:hypothetical protein
VPHQRLTTTRGMRSLPGRVATRRNNYLGLASRTRQSSEAPSLDGSATVTPVPASTSCSVAAAEGASDFSTFCCRGRATGGRDEFGSFHQTAPYAWPEWSMRGFLSTVLYPTDTSLSRHMATLVVRRY